jgi:hypothetical protein
MDIKPINATALLMRHGRRKSLGNSSVYNSESYPATNFACFLVAASAVHRREGAGCRHTVSGQAGNHMSIQDRHFSHNERRSVLRAGPVMHGVVKDLSKDQMQSVVAYLESIWTGATDPSCCHDGSRSGAR